MGWSVLVPWVRGGRRVGGGFNQTSFSTVTASIVSKESKG